MDYKPRNHSTKNFIATALLILGAIDVVGGVLVSGDSYIAAIGIVTGGLLIEGIVCVIYYLGDIEDNTARTTWYMKQAYHGLHSEDLQEKKEN